MKRKPRPAITTRHKVAPAPRDNPLDRDNLGPIAPYQVKRWKPTDDLIEIATTLLTEAQEIIRRTAPETPERWAAVNWLLQVKAQLSVARIKSDANRDPLVTTLLDAADTLVNASVSTPRHGNDVWDSVSETFGSSINRAEPVCVKAAPAPAVNDQLSVTDAATTLEISAGHVSRLCNTGKLKSTGKGAARRIDPASVTAYLQKRRRREDNRENNLR